ncbi:MAG: RNA-binding S4 domain-containing protein [Acidobacteria bacterium]|nr:RNA-binding S4 domain-containing protein [Acidobacteriota bacterium]MBI3655239.1 RNA-binding S4 domain-containing protein [Acidobacteriota bacterium]
MRLDLYLKHSRLVKRRSVAKELCDAGRVELNRKVAKSSALPKSGDILVIRFLRHTKTVEVLDIPSGQAPRKAVAALYRIIGDEPNDLLDGVK